VEEVHSQTGNLASDTEEFNSRKKKKKQSTPTKAKSVKKEKVGHFILFSYHYIYPTMNFLLNVISSFYYYRDSLPNQNMSAIFQFRRFIV
jgi:hypothetical protein